MTPGVRYLDSYGAPLSEVPTDVPPHYPDEPGIAAARRRINDSRRPQNSSTLPTFWETPEGAELSKLVNSLYRERSTPPDFHARRAAIEKLKEELCAAEGASDFDQDAAAQARRLKADIKREEQDIEAAVRRRNSLQRRLEECERHKHQALLKYREEVEIPYFRSLIAPLSQEQVDNVAATLRTNAKLAPIVEEIQRRGLQSLGYPTFPGVSYGRGAHLSTPMRWMRTQRDSYGATIPDERDPGLYCAAALDMESAFLSDAGSVAVNEFRDRTHSPLRAAAANLARRVAGLLGTVAAQF